MRNRLFKSVFLTWLLVISFLVACTAPPVSQPRVIKTIPTSIHNAEHAKVIFSNSNSFDLKSTPIATKFNTYNINVSYGYADAGMPGSDSFPGSNYIPSSPYMWVTPVSTATNPITGKTFVNYILVGFQAVFYRDPAPGYITWSPPDDPDIEWTIGEFRRTVNMGAEFISEDGVNYTLYSRASPTLRELTTYFQEGLPYPDPNYGTPTTLGPPQCEDKVSASTRSSKETAGSLTITDGKHIIGDLTTLYTMHVKIRGGFTQTGYQYRCSLRGEESSTATARLTFSGDLNFEPDTPVPDPTPTPDNPPPTEDCISPPFDPNNPDAIDPCAEPPGDDGNNDDDNNNDDGGSGSDDDCEEFPAILPNEMDELMQDTANFQNPEPQILRQYENQAEKVAEKAQVLSSRQIGHTSASNISMDVSSYYSQFNVVTPLPSPEPSNSSYPSPDPSSSGYPSPDPSGSGFYTSSFSTSSIKSDKQDQRLLNNYEELRLKYEQTKANLAQQINSYQPALEKLHQHVEANEFDSNYGAEYLGYYSEMPNTLEEFKSEFIELVTDTRVNMREKNTSEILSATQSYTRLALVYDHLLRSYLRGELPMTFPVDETAVEENEGELDTESGLSRFIARVGEITTTRKLINTWSQQLSRLKTKIPEKHAQLKQQVEADIIEALPETQEHIRAIQEAIFLSMVLEGLIDVNLDDYYVDPNGFRIQDCGPYQSINRPCANTPDELAAREKAIRDAYNGTNSLMRAVPTSVIEALLQASFEVQKPGLWAEMKTDGRANSIINGYMLGAGLIIPTAAEDIPLMLLGVNQGKQAYKLSKYGSEAALTALEKWLAKNTPKAAKAAGKSADEITKLKKTRELVQKKVGDLKDHTNKFNARNRKLAQACSGKASSRCNWTTKLSQKFAGQTAKVDEICKLYPNVCINAKKNGLPEGFRNFTVKYDNNGIPDFSTLRDGSGQLLNLVKTKGWIKSSTKSSKDAAQAADRGLYAKIWKNHAQNIGLPEELHTLGKARVNGHHTGNVRFNGNSIEIEIQIIDQSIHQLFPHRGGFEYARDIMAQNRWLK